MVELFIKGGNVMWGLLTVSLIALAFIIERAVTLLIKARLNPLKFVDRLKHVIEEEGIEKAKEICDNTPQPVAKILGAGLAKVKLGKEAVEESISAAGAVELAFLDRGMIWLAMSSTVAPILGFLGTVTGMIRAFDAIAKAGEVEPTIVASGISEALITTASGLAIAAPVVIFHTLYSAVINRYARDMEEAASVLVDYLIEKGLLKVKG